MQSTPPSSRIPQAVILGAGYAGLSVAKTIHRRAGSGIDVVLVDKSPDHVLRTELYQVDEIAAASANRRRWAVPMAEVLDGRKTRFVQGLVTGIDLSSKTIRLESETVPFDYLVICLGSVPSYFGIPGAKELGQEVYSLGGAERLAARLLEVERAAAKAPGAPRPRVVVVGGGSTGTEVAAEIATADWKQIADVAAPLPQVILLTGPMPFLQGFPAPLIRHSRKLLEGAAVEVRENTPVARVDLGVLTLKDGSTVDFDVCVWCAGVEAPPVVAQLPVEHGHGKRLKVSVNLELPQNPGVFAVGDVIEYANPGSGVLVPSTAQAALSGAPVAGYNVVARHLGKRMKRFSYHEKGVIISLGLGKGVGRAGPLTLWGRPAYVLKSLVEAEYSLAVERG
ncbi:MAG: FAD-dependent oxidoreductase [Thermoplasmata archaeon]|nr:FAD-dependent oxidoreductase [Thermoplasmata archaeon]